MKQRSTMFEVIAEIDNLMICEAVLFRGGWRKKWRFAVEWDEDRDERVIPVVEKMIFDRVLFDLEIVKVKESKGCLHIHTMLNAAETDRFPSYVSVLEPEEEGEDVWCTHVEFGASPCASGATCGERRTNWSVDLY
jgi:hypothetical protein